MKQLSVFIIAIFILTCFCSLTNSNNGSIECSNDECRGKYEGAEFINGSDIAHQLSNKMSEAVGNKLKKLFNKGEYSKVDFDKIEKYKLEI